VKFEGVEARDLIPSYIPDVFAGKPVYVHGRYAKAGRATVEVVGRVGAQPSAARMEIQFPGAEEGHSPLPSIWARQQIKQLELDKLASANPQAVEEQITRLALEFSLMSAYTSFVAVDGTATEFAGGQLRLVPVTVPMPQGVKYETTISNNTMATTSGTPVARNRPASAPPPNRQRSRKRSRGGGWDFGGGGGPVGPVVAAAVGILAALEWRRRRKGSR
jgi:Ca-activated chloride channel family protein